MWTEGVDVLRRVVPSLDNQYTVRSMRCCPVNPPVHQQPPAESVGVGGLAWATY